MQGKKSRNDGIKWEEPLCDNCKSIKYEILLDNVTTWEHDYKFREVRCENCGLVYLSPRPKKEFISKFYSTETYWGTYLSSDEGVRGDLKNRSLYFGRIYKDILKRKKKGSIFDVGFGTGLFLTYFNETGWKTGGVELSDDAAKYAKRAFGLKELKSGSIEDLTFKKNSADVVTFNSSLEHLYTPKRVLTKINGMLKKNGLLVITVPNLESLGFLVFNKHWLGLHPPKHLYNFTPRTLSTMLENAKFNIEKIDHWSWHHSYYSFFESFRYMISPRFRALKQVKGEYSEKLAVNYYNKNMITVIIKRVGILFIISFACLLSLIGSFIKKGEVITVYAKKN